MGSALGGSVLQAVTTSQPSQWQDFYVSLPKPNRGPECDDEGWAPPVGTGGRWALLPWP